MPDLFSESNALSVVLSIEVRPSWNICLLLRLETLMINRYSSSLWGPASRVARSKFCSRIWLRMVCSRSCDKCHWLYDHSAHRLRYGWYLYICMVRGVTSMMFEFAKSRVEVLVMWTVTRNEANSRHNHPMVLAWIVMTAFDHILETLSIMLNHFLIHSASVGTFELGGKSGISLFKIFLYGKFSEWKLTFTQRHAFHLWFFDAMIRSIRSAASKQTTNDTTQCCRSGLSHGLKMRWRMSRGDVYPSRYQHCCLCKLPNITSTSPITC